jgi:hypothetical protein
MENETLTLSKEISVAKLTIVKFKIWFSEMAFPTFWEPILWKILGFQKKIHLHFAFCDKLQLWFASYPE